MEKVSEGVLRDLREMSGTTAVKGGLLNDIIDEVFALRSIERAAMEFVRLQYNCTAEEWAIAIDALRTALQPMGEKSHG